MKILLHVCCGNCSLYPVKILLSEKHRLTGLWFNPNIHPFEEYRLRLDSLKRLSKEWKFEVRYDEDYRPEEYFSLFNINDREVMNGPPSGGLNGLSSFNNLPIPPFPARCTSCYQLRLEKTAQHAHEQGFDAFSTTLLISPYQDFEEIVSAGKALSEKYSVLFHLKDFRPHFRDAMNLSKELGLYRQKYCGCIFSKIERMRKRGRPGRSNGI